MDAENIAAKKQELRKRLKAARAAIPAEERARIDAEIAQRVADLPEYVQASALFTYLSFGNEIDTRALAEAAWAAGKIVALPRCVGERTMAWHRVDSFANLELSSFGVEEPADDPATRLDPASQHNAVAIVPGLAFDERGYRLGYGGGFYDTFLADFAGVSVGLCRDELLRERLEVLGEYDLPVRIVVTERRVLRCGDYR